MFEDKTLVCKDCGKEFVWTAGEQEFYASRGFENQPQRCKPCRDARKNGVRGGNNGGGRPVSVRCSMLSAQLAARLARFPSSPVRTVRSTALTASLA